MPIDDLRSRSLPSSARAGRSPGREGPPEPGDLFVLPVTAELPVEWALLERRPADQGFLAVPADANPLAGSGDVEVAVGEPGGPLSLRCRFPTQLDAGLLKPELRSGALSPDAVAAARRRLQRVESGTLAPSPLEEEVDAETEYRDWIRDVPARARELVLAARPAARRPGSGRWTGYLAALFALAAAGLAVQVMQLRREVDRLSAPVFDVSPQEVVLGETPRGGKELKIPADDTHVLLTLVVDASIPPQDARFEILDARGQPVWSSKPLRLAPRDYRLILLRSRLPDGEYRVRIVPEAGGRPLSVSTFAIRTRS